ncbi:MAG: hypothetical protein DI573_14275 [Microbacterium sp.]|nr:MAG: hypothetical protein DI573_14275 [Microbacterium sp.]
MWSRDRSSAPASFGARADRPVGEEVSEFARHGDPSLEGQPLGLSGGETVRSEIVWMRPTELVPAVTGRVAGQGIDLESSIARCARALPTQSVAATRRAIRDRALQLPPVTAFGTSRHAHGAVRRSGIGR